MPVLFCQVSLDVPPLVFDVPPIAALVVDLFENNIILHCTLVFSWFLGSPLGGVKCSLCCTFQSAEFLRLFVRYCRRPSCRMQHL